MLVGNQLFAQYDDSGNMQISTGSVEYQMTRTREPGIKGACKHAPSTTNDSKKARGPLIKFGDSCFPKP